MTDHTHDHTQDNTAVQHAQCTCNEGHWPGGPEWDPDCPLHGRYAEPTTVVAEQEEESDS